MIAVTVDHRKLRPVPADRQVQWSAPFAPFPNKSKQGTKKLILRKKMVYSDELLEQIRKCRLNVCAVLQTLPERRTNTNELKHST